MSWKDASGISLVWGRCSVFFRVRIRKALSVIDFPGLGAMRGLLHRLRRCFSSRILWGTALSAIFRCDFLLCDFDVALSIADF